jgi:V/A-type H+/Na+-transporting ATPase subunit I
MIVKMKKIAVIAMQKYLNETLAQLKEAGVLHIQKKTVESDDKANLIEQKNEIMRALTILSDYTAEAAQQCDFEGSIEKSNHVLEQIEEKRALHEENERLQKEYEKYLAWGDFEPEDLKALESDGVYIHLHEIKPDVFSGFADEHELFVIDRNKYAVKCASITLLEPEGPDESDLTPLPLPEKSLSSFKAHIEKNKASLQKIEQKITEIASYRESLQEATGKIDDMVEFEEAKASFENDEGFVALSGFVPAAKLDVVHHAAAEHGWGIAVSEPDENDEVPTLVQNPRWIRIIEPVFNFLETIPGYKEFDISFWFLLFFTIFFSMIIGDAGYGTVLLLISLYSIIKSKARKKKTSNALILFTVLSISTLAWGAVTGNWFGSDFFIEKTFLHKLVIPSLNSFEPRSVYMVKLVCFVLGTVHLGIARIWQFISALKQKPFIKAFAQLGWFFMLVGLFNVVIQLVLDANFYIPYYSDYAIHLIAAGFIFVIIFSEQEGNFVKGIIKGIQGLMITFLDSISAFSNIISYIRLFAVGLASIEIAKSFNGMAANAANGIVGIVFAVLILCLGHTLNLVMGALSVIVHGIRLKMLEFSGHLGMEWSGIAYKPFKEKLKETA